MVELRAKFKIGRVCISLRLILFHISTCQKSFLRFLGLRNLETHLKWLKMAETANTEKCVLISLKTA